MVRVIAGADIFTMLNIILNRMECLVSPLLDASASDEETADIIASSTT